MNTLHIPCETGLISDGYHSFDELYEHRHMLFLALAIQHPTWAWCSRRHSDGTEIKDWFIAGIILPEAGTITYHLPSRLWDLAVASGVFAVDKSPMWDGHTATDVLQRLRTYIERKE